MSRRFILAAVASVAALAAPAVAHADAVTQWNLNASSALMVTAGQGPQLSVPHMAMVHGAVYDAVNAIDGGHEGYLLTSRVATPFDSQEAAAATAAYLVLLNLVPAQKATLDGQYAASLAPIPDGTAKTRGIAVGGAAAAAMIAARTDDGRFGAYRFPVGTGPGQWRPVLPAFVNDPFAWLKDVKPFLIKSGYTVRLGRPCAAREQEVRARAQRGQVARICDEHRLGRRTRRWRPATGRRTRRATWSRIFRTLSAQQNVSLTGNARLYAMLYMSAADALITVWNDKAEYLFWRPITAIREADTDGNPDTVADPAWLPLIPTPPYTEHSSGHNGLSGAIVATLQDFFGTDRIGWTDTNNGGFTRSYTRFSDAIEEIIEVRIWSGIHFRSADEQAAKIGKQVARYREQHFFDRVHGHDDEEGEAACWAAEPAAGAGQEPPGSSLPGGSCARQRADGEKNTFADGVELRLAAELRHRETHSDAETPGPGRPPHHDRRREPADVDRLLGGRARHAVRLRAAEPRQRVREPPLLRPRRRPPDHRLHERGARARPGAHVDGDRRRPPRRLLALAGDLPPGRRAAGRARRSGTAASRTAASWTRSTSRTRSAS